MQKRQTQGIHDENGYMSALTPNFDELKHLTGSGVYQDGDTPKNHKQSEFSFNQGFAGEVTDRSRQNKDMEQMP